MFSERASLPLFAKDVSNEIGVDVKYGLTQSLTADFTCNTDFAQVEADEQRDTLSPRFPNLVNRSFIAKVNRLVRF